MTTKREVKILLTVYKNIYGTEFVPLAVGEKLKMHKLIYLLQESDVKCGDFDFFWHINGPYSHNLHKKLLEIEDHYTPEEIHECSNGCTFKAEAEKIMQNLKSMFSKAADYGYSIIDWCEALGSIHFIKKYRCNYESDDRIIAILEKEKPNLNRHAGNLGALQLLRENNFLSF